MPTDPAFEVLAEKLQAVREPEPIPPLPAPMIKGRNGVPETAIQQLNALVVAPRPSTPFGRDVEVVDDK